MKVEIGIMEAKFENAQRVLEADLQSAMEKQVCSIPSLSEPYREKTGLWGFQLGLTQPGFTTIAIGLKFLI